MIQQAPNGLARIKNVQQTLAAIGSWARTDVGLPNAAPGIRGIAAIATQAMIDAGTDTQTIVTPALLQYRLQNPKATQIVWGYTKYATDAEAVTITNDLVSLTPRSINTVFNSRKATESLWGSTKYATTAQATAGADDTTSMTPLKVKQAISALVPVQSSATESAEGLVRLATVAQVQAGTIREGYAISPFTFARLTSTESANGVLKIATQAQMNAGTDNTSAVTPAKFNSTRANASTFGVVLLSTTLSGAANTALSSNAQVLPSYGQGVTSGDLYRGNTAVGNKYQTRDEVNAIAIPVGTIVMAGYGGDRGNVLVCDGRGLNRNTWAELFAAIGYNFGGSGDIFNLPDMRGLVARGVDHGRGLDPGRGFGSYQDDTMQPITANWVYDDQAGWCNYPPSGAVYIDGAGSVNYDADSNMKYWRAYKMHFDSSRVTRTSHETRVKSLALNYVIRAR